MANVETSSTFAAGVALNIFGSIIINFGTNLMKLGHNNREKQKRMEKVST